MKEIKYILAFFFAAILMVGCARHRELSYFHDAPRDSASPIENSYQGAVHKGDRLHIYVSAQDAESTIPFNQETNRLMVAAGLTDAASAPASALGYLVDNQGDIAFPVLGRLHVEGLTLDSLSGLVSSLLHQQHLVLNPEVTVRLLNFRVAVIGEVVRPDWVQVKGNRLTILEALAMAGDMTLYGQRQNVRVIREVNGQTIVGQVDMTSADLFDSPYYYLQQNDVVFVEPNRKKRREYGRNDYIMSYIQMGVSIGALTTSTARAALRLMEVF